MVYDLRKFANKTEWLISHEQLYYQHANTTKYRYYNAVHGMNVNGFSIETEQYKKCTFYREKKTETENRNI